jgi:CDP-diacylglycerol---glycerol-3-phosphate 3-phosphatidyltransferase
MKIRRPAMHKHIPNALTILRFLLVPVFVYFLFTCRCEHSILISLIIFAVASLTDYVDGYLARKWQVISDFGKIMDPLADKLLVISALIGLTWLEPFKLPILIVIVIVIRELGITILREFFHKKGIVVAADNLGKLKTVMQMAGIIFALAIMAFVPDVSSKVVLYTRIWFWLVVGITLISGMNYLKALFKKEA